MYNEVKINMIDDNCDCEYVISEAGTAITPFVYIRMFLGDIDFSAVEIRATYNGGTEWALPEVHGVENLETGWYMTRLSYSDFSKSGNYELEVRAYYNGEMYGNKTLLFFHNNLQSTGEWNLTKQHGVIRDAYNVQQGSSASGSGSGGGGSGGATYTAGNGIDITDSNEIKAKIDHSTIQFNSYGEMVAKVESGLTIENAVIIKEADSKYLLHEYKEVEYIAGNKIGYAGVSNQIITQGYVAYNVDKLNSGYFSTIPDMQLATDFVFERPVFLNYNASSVYSIKRIYLRFKQAYTIYNRYEIVYVTTEGVELIATTINAYFNRVESFAALGLAWQNVYSSGYTTTVGKQYCEFGCAHCIPIMVFSYNASSSSDTWYQVGRLSSAVYWPYIQFASEAEYNAAVGLTYTPATLIQVNETTTEV